MCDIETNGYFTSPKKSFFRTLGQGRDCSQSSSRAELEMLDLDRRRIERIKRSNLQQKRPLSPLLELIF